MLKSTKLQSSHHYQPQPHHHTQKNVINSIMSFLPDNRPITSLQIVEDYERCPKNFTPVHRTYDQDSDADLWRETNILFGKPTSRYLCLSKSEGLPEYVVETLRIIAEKELPPKEFSLLSRTADSEQKAWRKKQITYKLTKRGMVSNAVTDIILCSKLKTAPSGFTLAGDINGILVCYKTGPIPVRLPPPVPVPVQNKFNVNTNELETALNKVNIKKTQQPIPSATSATEHDYEEIQASYQLSPKRPAPKPPIVQAVTGTLGAYSEIEGVPFVLNPNLSKNNFEMPTLKVLPSTTDLDYNFQLERQILCTVKSATNKNLTNPFFK